MDGARSKARFDWLVELAGALAPGLAAGFAALKLAPSLGIAPHATMSASGFGGFGLGLLAMRLVRPAPRRHALAGFDVAPIVAGEEALLLEDRYDEPIMPAGMEKPAVDDALLLDDPLEETDPASRVVQLFANQPMPTPGQLKERIDRHLVGGSRLSPDSPPIKQPDATGALHAALDELRRSLR
jgi:hypothetical protein